MELDKLVEQKIRDAQEAGDFDHLTKQGPISFEEESDVPEEMRLAYHMLKAQGFAPDWIEQDKELRSRLDQARQAVARSWLWYRARLEDQALAGSYEERQRADEEWKRARGKFEYAIAELNKEVFDFNLRVPSVYLQRLPLRLSEEYKALGISE